MTDQDTIRAGIVRYYSDMLKFALSLARNRTLAEDAAQNACITALRYDRPLAEPGRVKQWLLGHVRFAVMTLKRATIHRSTGESRQVADGEEVLTAIRVDGNQEAALYIRSMDRVLSGMPHNRRACFECIVMAGEAVEDVATRLGITVHAVYNQIYEARAEVRPLFS